MTSDSSPGSVLRSLTDDAASWVGSSLVSVEQIDPSGLQLLFDETSQMRSLVRDGGGGDDRLKHCVVGTVFFEASTRTSCSFQAAALRLGAGSVHVDAAAGNSSAAKKGETLEDTCRCLECYSDLLVLRHPVEGSAARVAQHASKPLINAGDGVGEHPTQALLDVFTIYDELQLRAKVTPGPLTVVMLGDLKHGRTVHSLAKLLCTCRIWADRLTLRYCCPSGLEMPEKVVTFCESFSHLGVVQELHHDNLGAACQGAQVLYVTRIQGERFADAGLDYEKVKGSYVVDKNLMDQAPADMVVLHPLPRVDEISTEVDSDPRAAYFRQMENGMFVRMALLSLILHGKK